MLNRRPANFGKVTSAEKTDGSANVRHTVRPLFVASGHAPQRRVPDGSRIYVVGDIHGQLEGLLEVLNKIRIDVNSRPVPEFVTVFIGDYIDRGLNSRSVIDRVMNETGVGKKVTLRGNHEQVMLAALDDAERMRDWCEIGGVQTLFSYGVDVRDLMRGRGFEAARTALLEVIPASHVTWLRGLPVRYETAGYFFCHAGIDPDRPLDAQRDADLLWVRDRFMRDERDFPKIIVHGHSPVPRIDIRHNRINVDTGAFCTGNLSCISLEQDQVICL
jgi:serine/threonine protein phosphatase 1